MTDLQKTGSPPPDLKCPECRAPLRPRRGKNSDPCELICGGCGKQFNGCVPKDDTDADRD